MGLFRKSKQQKASRSIAPGHHTTTPPCLLDPSLSVVIPHVTVVGYIGGGGAGGGGKGEEGVGKGEDGSTGKKYPYLFPCPYPSLYPYP